MDANHFFGPTRRLTAMLLMAVSLCATPGCLTPPRQWLKQHLKVGPNYCPPAVPIAPEWIDADNPSLVTASGNYSSWWQVFGDPLLNALEEEAAAENLQLRQAAMRVVEARALLYTARGTLGPQSQQATGGFSRIKSSETTAFQFPVLEYDRWNVGFNASWELDLWGRFRRLVEAAEANHEESIFNYDDVLVVLQAEIASAYVQMRTLQQRLTIVRRNVELQEETLGLAQTRFENGRVSELDVAQASTNLEATRATIPPLEEAIRKTQNALCVLLGAPPFDISAETTAGAIPTAPEQVVVGIPADLLRRRPDVRAAERQVAIQSALLGISESNLYPHVALTGSIGLESEKFSDLFRSESLAGSIGPGFSWDILNYGRLINGYRAQEARFQQALLGYRQVVLDADRATEDAIISYLKERETIATLQSAVTSAERAVEIATLQYSEGKADFQRVLDSQRVLVLRQELLASSRGQVSENLVKVYKELGGGWQTRYAEIPAENLLPVASFLPSQPAPEELDAPQPEMLPEISQPK
ncbi:MAG: transporter [Planctomycetaceae bacterium]|nr:transporter [Planctomycetaceae bacterium]